MIVSMTGFATRSIELKNSDGVTAYLTMNLKSLNSRFFEATCKLPYQLQSLEIPIIQSLKKELIRGKVSITLHISNPTIFKQPIKASIPIIKNYAQAIEHIKKEVSLSGALSVGDLIQLPDIFITEEKLADETMQEKILTSMQKLTADLKKVRSLEGADLAADITQRLTLLEKTIAIIAERSEKVFKEKDSLLQKELKAIDHEQSELAEIRRNELTHALERIDITEEIVRFKSHLTRVTSVLHDTNREKGRRLDFILQELNREINTIAAKCSDAEMSSNAIGVKIELEKIREQAQNLV